VENQAGRAIKLTTAGQRSAAIRAAGYTTFLLRSNNVYFDLLPDSGTSGMVKTSSLRTRGTAVGENIEVRILGAKRAG
jgi:tryptophanase